MNKDTQGAIKQITELIEEFSDVRNELEKIDPTKHKGKVLAEVLLYTLSPASKSFFQTLKNDWIDLREKKSLILTYRLIPLMPKIATRMTQKNFFANSNIFRDVNSIFKIIRDAIFWHIAVVNIIQDYPDKFPEMSKVNWNYLSSKYQLANKDYIDEVISIKDPKDQKKVIDLSVNFTNWFMGMEPDERNTAISIAIKESCIVCKVLIRILTDRMNTILAESKRLDIATSGNESPKKMAPPNDLTDTEKNILEALAGNTLIGADLLKRAGYDNSSHYRTILSNLVKRGILGNNKQGYFKK